MAFPPYGTTVPSLSNWQLYFQGLTLGEGTAYGIQKHQGLDGGQMRSGDSARPRSHGELVGIDLAQGRDILLTGDVNSDGTSLQHALEAVSGLMAPGRNIEAPLWFQFPGAPLLGTMVRPRINTTAIDVAWGAGLAQKVLHFHSTDYRLYAAPGASTVGLGTPLGGLRFPVTFPATFGGGSVAGIISADNAGNVDTHPILVITGPCTNPTIENSTTGWSLSFANPFSGGYTLNSGDTLTIDTDLRTITYVAAGTTTGVSRANWLVPGSIWPDPVQPIEAMAPGVNTIEFTSQDATTVTGTLQVQWASAYLFT